MKILLAFYTPLKNFALSNSKYSKCPSFTNVHVVSQPLSKISDSFVLLTPSNMSFPRTCYGTQFGDSR